MSAPRSLNAHSLGEIRRLHSAGKSLRSIAEVIGCSKDTIARALAVVDVPTRSVAAPVKVVAVVKPQEPSVVRGPVLVLVGDWVVKLDRQGRVAGVVRSTGSVPESVVRPPFQLLATTIGGGERVLFEVNEAGRGMCPKCNQERGLRHLVDVAGASPSALFPSDWFPDAPEPRRPQFGWMRW